MKKNIIVLLMSLVMVMTSCIGVFAADSPTKGFVPAGKVSAKSQTRIKASWNDMGAAYYVIKVGKKTYTVNGLTASLKVAKNKNYNVTLTAYDGNGNVIGSTKLGSVSTKKTVKKPTVKRTKKKKLKVRWTSVKGASGYSIVVYKNGAYLKTVKTGKKATSKSFNLKHGRYKFKVTPIYKSTYKGITRTSKTIKA